MTHFQLFDKFHSFYNAGKNICVTSDGFIISDDGESINYIDKNSLRKINQFNKTSEEMTCFVSNPDDYTVIMADKNLMLKMVDRSNLSKHPKIWNSCHKAPIFTMCLNKSSTRLTTGGADSKVRIWHIGQGEGKSFCCTYHKSKINILRNHPLLNMVVSSSMLDFDIVAWDTETGKLLGVFSGHQDSVTGIDFHELSNQMATSSRDETVIIWNCENFNKLILIPVMESLETCVIVSDFMNQPEADAYLVMVGGASGIIKTVSPSKRVIIQEFKKASLFENIETADINKDKSGLKTIRSILQTIDSLIFVRESDNIEFYSKQMQLEYELSGNLSDVKDIMIVGKEKDLILVVESAPYMRLFACKSFEETELENDSDKLSLWPCQLVHGGHSKDITSVSVFSDGLHIVSGGKDGKVSIWQVEDSAKLLLKLITSIVVENDIVSSVCVDRKGKFIYVHYSIEDCLAVLSLKGNKLTRKSCFSKPHSNIISTMEMNINSSLLATGSKDKNVKLWSYKSKSKELIIKGVLKGHKRCISSVKFSDTEQLLLTASLDKVIKLWSVESLTCLQDFKSPTAVHRAMFYNNEKQIISCHSDGTMIVWNRDTGKDSSKFDIHDGQIDCFTLITDTGGNCRGFAAASSMSMMCLYRDETEKNLEKSKLDREQQTQEEQELNNLLFENKFVHALRLAIKLNKPVLTYNTLNAINDNNEQPADEAIGAFELPDKTDMGKAVKSLDLTELRTLFSFAVKWMTNNRTCLIGEYVIGIMLGFIADAELTSWPEYSTYICAFRSYSDQHYRRENEQTNSTGFNDYLGDAVTGFNIIDLTMDSS